MNLYEQFGTDAGLEKNGVKIPIGDMVFTLKHSGGANKAFAKALEEKSRPFRLGRTGEIIISDDQADRMMYEIYADHIVVDWKGVKGPDGKDLPFSRENCIKVFTDLPKFFLVIKQQAESISNFQNKQIEADSGNSSAS